MATKRPPIKFTNKDFESIKANLIEYAKIYYPETYRDFNEASFGSLLFDMVSYVGDVLSFYVDYQINESFIDSAIETGNIVRLAKQLGYKHPGSSASSGFCSFFIEIPANANGQPNSNAIPVLKRGTTLISNGGASFILNDDVNFSGSSVQVVVANTNDNGLPTSYAYKATGEIISGMIETEFVDIGQFEKFKKVKLSGDNITEIISVIDADGHEFFEVDYLSQNIVFKAIRNTSTNDNQNAPYILREMIVPRRFTVEHTVDGEIFLQFGHGSDELLKENKFPDPTSVVLQQFGKIHFSETSFDPNVLVSNDKFGVVPVQGTMVVTYRKNTVSNVNVPSKSISSITNPLFLFNSGLAASTATSVRNSIEVENEEPINGQVKPLNASEIRIRAIDTFSSQNRAVTKQDYVSLIHRMPAKFGSVKRANIVQDKKSFKRNLNLYVVSEDQNGRLIQTNSTIKENLKVWLNNFKMINDTIDILDGRIANIGIEFEIIADINENPTVVLTKAVQALRKEYANKLFFGVPFYISDIFKILNDLPEVIDTKSVKIVNKLGTDYSATNYDVESNVTDDNRFLIVPDDVVLEIKFPEKDIVGLIS